jgi:hypothetical protein
MTPIEAVALIAVIYTVVILWMGAELISAKQSWYGMNDEINDLRATIRKMDQIEAARRAAAISPLPEIYTPEQMAERPARRWHEQNKDVEKALKWDDAAKGEQ